MVERFVGLDVSQRSTSVCNPAWKKGPAEGVIGARSGPLR